jgi:nucleoside permease NupC
MCKRVLNNLIDLTTFSFFPLAYIMGVTSSHEETLRVAQLMGTKTALNEFIAYKKLGQMVQDKLISVALKLQILI